MNFPDDETGAVLAEMHEAGVDLTQPHTVEFFQLFEQQHQAKAMADFLIQSEPTMKVKLHPDQTPNVWDVDCEIEMIPSYENIVAMENKLGSIADKFDGYNDGWGVHVD